MHCKKSAGGFVYVVLFVLLCVSCVIPTISLAADDFTAPEKSNLIIDCTFGKERAEGGTDDGTGHKEQCGIGHLFQLAENVMRLLLWLAIVGAGVLIFYKGARLAINVFIKGGHQQARQQVQDALLATTKGLILILSAYLLVQAGFRIVGYNLNGGNPFEWNESSLSEVQQTPNPGPAQLGDSDADGDATDGDDDDDAVDDSAVSGGDDRVQTETAQCVQVGGGTAECTCKDCTVPVGITFTEDDSTKMHQDLAAGLVNLKSKTADPAWVVTEAWPTTRGHSGACHYVGTCVDIDFSASYDDEDIEVFIQQASASGLLAVFETKDSATADRLKARSGIPNKNVFRWDDITGDHFSVYNCTLPSPPRVCSR